MLVNCLVKMLTNWLVKMSINLLVKMLINWLVKMLINRMVKMLINWINPKIQMLNGGWVFGLLVKILIQELSFLLIG